MNAKRRLTVLGVTLALALACASDPGTPPGLAWAEAAPAEFPRAGATIEEALAALSPKRTTNALVQARDVRVLRIDVEPWVSIPRKDVNAEKLTDAEALYAVVADLSCMATAGLQRIYGEKVAWYLLPGGALSAWDHWEFGDACTGSNHFEPARDALVPHEKRLVAWMHEHLPKSVTHAAELYLKGAAYARAGRLDDARAMLAAGDEAFDFTDDYKIVQGEGRGRRFTADRQALRGHSRELLVREIGQAEARDAGAVPGTADVSAP